VDFVLVVPPCASAALPVLGPAVLAAACRQAGLQTHVAHVNLEMAARIGYDRYRRFALSCSRMHGEMLFSEAAFDRPVHVVDEDFEDEPDSVSAEDFAAGLASVPGLIADAADAIAAMAPPVVGFSSVFQQNLASIALARAVRARLPDAVLLFGGANASRPMCDGIAEVTDVFDVIVSGEADLELPALVGRSIEQGRPGGGTRILDLEPVRDLDLVPAPDLSDFIDQAAVQAALGRLPEGLPIALPFEASRGCWWGERSHCRFCGLNGAEIAMRLKSPERVLQDIEQLADLHPQVPELRASDNLLPLSIQRELLPVLAARRGRRDPPLSFIWEVKSSLRRKDLELLAAAGVQHVQAGTESLSTPALQRIAKGTTGPMNIAFLRECRATDVDPLWNWMVGFPGDEREEYESTLRLIPLIEHLRPPMALAPIRVDRYSPYFERPEEHGIVGITPLPGMERVWPEGAPIGQIAYHFTAELRSPYRDDPSLGLRVHAAVAGWNALWSGPAPPPALVALPLDDGRLRIVDTRRAAVQPTVELSMKASALLLHLERPRPAEAVEHEADAAALSELLYRNFVADHDGKLLSLVVRPA
jgi:ribosomal peptide maturation radical SAM protein 1